MNLYDHGYDFTLYWSNREENAEKCAAKLAQMLNGLAAIDPVFGQWKNGAATLAEAHEPFISMPPDESKLATILIASESKPYDPRPTLRYAFSTSAWNGLDEPYIANFSVSPGTYNSRNARANWVTLGMSRCRLKTGNPWQGGELRGIMRLLIDIWDADEGLLRCSRYAPDSPRNEMGKVLLPRPGWLTYLTAQQLLKVALPKGVRVDELPQGGAICTICEAPFRVDNPRHVELAEALNRAMRPIQAYPVLLPDPTDRDATR